MKKKKRKLVFPEMEQVIPVHLLDYKTVYKTVKKGVKGKIPKYNIFYGRLPNSKNEDLVIIDPYMNQFLTTMGLQNISYNGLSKAAIEILKKDGWYNTDTMVHKFIFTTNPKKFFKKCDNWLNLLNFLIYQGLHKDHQLMRCIKSWIIPHPFNSQLQEYNNHAFCFTQTSTGKTRAAHNIGYFPVRDATWAGLIGSTDTKGILNGHGAMFLDECNITPDQNNPGGPKSDSLIGKLLDYMVQGVTNRAIHGSLGCTGTKTIVFFGNPPLNSQMFLANGLSHIFKSIGAQDAANRVGERIGLFVAGVDYDRVSGTPPAYCIGYKAEERYLSIKKIIHESILLTRSKYEKMFMKYIPWMHERDQDYIDIRAATNIEKLQLADFADGLIKGNGQKRLRCAALKLTLAENLDKFVMIGIKDYMKETEEALERNYGFLKQVNIDSIKRLEGIPDHVTESQFWDALDKDRKIFGMSDRQLSILLNVSHSTVGRWIKKYAESFKIKNGKFPDGYNPEKYGWVKW